MPHSGFVVVFYLYLCLVVAPFVNAGSLFNIQDTYIGNGFLNGFNWNTFDDPTHGRVNYVDQPTALLSNLTWGMLRYLSLDNPMDLTRNSIERQVCNAC